MNQNTDHCTEVRFASFLSGGFITAILVNPPERKQAKRNYLQSMFNKKGLSCRIGRNVPSLKPTKIVCIVKSLHDVNTWSMFWSTVNIALGKGPIN